MLSTFNSYSWDPQQHHFNTYSSILQLVINQVLSSTWNISHCESWKRDVIFLNSFI